MAVVLPLYGYVERQFGEADGVRNNPDSAVNARRIKRVTEFCQLIGDAVKQGFTSRFIGATAGNELLYLSRSGLFFEKDVDNRPQLSELIRRCTKDINAKANYSHGAIVITKVEDIFHEHDHHERLDLLETIVRLNIPVFAVEDAEFESVINNIRRSPRKEESYDDLIHLSLIYTRSMANLLKRRKKQQL